ncbi:hypothetical protein GCM10011613_13020 [Cellvibrio zantedeschiae]|uniref:Chromosome partitioning protein ParA n=1 Tax=Cellvibrio zantedeschiae TaxID=1237077 RepID=A0ABQ3AX01_9GAMM|nr:hypothetical protein [Cellvibrio zantedeschiae]GGY70029.1 hypothetical protein GCM10011613_13020 [Cellvibrio zantedeschiae]
MTLESTDSVEAVVLFKGDVITRELLYPEFEAILDGFVPVPDFKGSSAKAAYLVINSNLQITAAVFFLLDFDDRGMIDRRWNVPLQQLAEVSGRGPDLGAGPIRLACYSQCAIGWHQKKLWDPQMDPATSSFAQLKKCVQNNRLGVIFRKPAQERLAAVPTAVAQPVHEQNSLALQQKIHEHYALELRNQTASLIKEQRLRIATLHSKQQETIQKLQHEHQQRLQAYQEKIKELKTLNVDLELRNRSLKESFDVQASKVEGMREYFSHKLKAAQNDENSQIQALQENFAVELALKLQTATAELREMLDMREVELFYRHQNETTLKEEIVNIKQEYQELLNNSGEQVLTRLDKAGVNFVVYHPGAGQFTIPLADLSQYIENPTAYVAKNSGVGEKLYSVWFDHYQNPSCKGLDANGHACGKPLVRIGSPIEFHEGESDRCEHHQLISYKLVSEKR